MSSKSFKDFNKKYGIFPDEYYLYILDMIRPSQQLPPDSIEIISQIISPIIEKFDTEFPMSVSKVKKVEWLLDGIHNQLSHSSKVELTKNQMHKKYNSIDQYKRYIVLENIIIYIIEEGGILARLNNSDIISEELVEKAIDDLKIIDFYDGKKEIGGIQIENLMDCKIPELKMLCKKNNLPTNKNKSELCTSLRSIIN